MGGILTLNKFNAALNPQGVNCVVQRINMVMVRSNNKVSDSRSVALIQYNMASKTPRLISLFAGVAFLAMMLAAVLYISATPVRAQEESSSAPVDLTKLVPPAPDNPETAEPQTEPETSTGGTEAATPSEGSNISANPASSSLTVTKSLTRKDPASIRLGSLGLDRADVDGLGRQMWEGSNAQEALVLLASLDPARSPHALRPALNHIMTAQAEPPEGFLDIAPQIIDAKLSWLAASGASDDLAEFIRQLPDTGEWEDRYAWLVLHDLIVRNDEDACGSAQNKVSVTLDALWHQVNAFCGLVRGAGTQAAFALDILEDSGVEDPLYFNLMRRLQGGEEFVIGDQSDISFLNLILMDSARIVIEADGIKTVPKSYSQSIKQLRNLSPAASRLIGARSFDTVSAEELTLSWTLLPLDSISLEEALTILRESDDEDMIATARLNAWHAISAEKDETSAAKLAFEAMVADYNHSGIAALGLWLPLIEGGIITSPEIDSKIGPLIGFVDTPAKILMNDEATAWYDILTPSRRPLSAETLVAAEAHDAIPVLLALGRPVANSEGDSADFDVRSLAAETIPVPIVQMMHVEQAAEKGLKAETLLRVARILQDRDLSALSRDDAARLISVLMRVDLEETAQRLARDILITWSVDRHFNSLANQVQES
jgi:hypothetical protein